MGGVGSASIVFISQRLLYSEQEQTFILEEHIPQTTSDQLSRWSKQRLKQQLDRALGQSASEAALANWIKQIEIVEPPPGQRFWQTPIAHSGICIILEGKARLLDDADNLVVSLESGTCFGEQSLFPEQSFRAYSVRASQQLKLLYVRGEWVRSLCQHSPDISMHLRQRAVFWEILLLSRELPGLQHLPVAALMAGLNHLEHDELKPGTLPSSRFSHSLLWFVYQGELHHSSGLQLTAHHLYSVSSLPPGQSWQITQPTVLYSLSTSRLEMALAQFPELATLLEAGIVPSSHEHTHGYSNGRTGHRRTIEPIRQPVPPPFRSHQSDSRTRKISRAEFPTPTLRVRQWWNRVSQRYPFVQQQSISDCGAACLAMIGRYWGKQFSMNRLRNLSNVDRNGTSLRGLATAAESLGFSTRPVKADLDGLARQKLPAIVHWKSNHYIVVYEIKRQGVIVADPAIGQRQLTRKAFQTDWTGYALLLQPTVLLKTAAEANQPIWQFFELLKPHWLVLAEIFITSILIQIFGLVTPLFTQLLLDRVIVQRSESTLMAIGLGLLIFGVFRVAMTGLRQYLLDHTANRVDLSLIVGFIKHTFQLPLAFFEARYVGDIIARVQENRKIQRFLTGEALTILLDLITVFVYLGVMFWYSWKMALLTSAVVPPYLLLALLSTPLLRRVSREIFGAVTEETGYLIQSLTGIHTVKTMAVEQTVRWHWEELFGKSIKKVFSGQIIRNVLQIFSAMIDTITTTALLWFGAWLVIHDELTVGQLVAFNMLLSNVIRPFQRLAVLWNELQEVVISIERINDVIDAEPEEELQQMRQSLPTIQGQIQFEQVTFRYHPDSDANILENLSFAVQPGQTVAIVGRSGSGKTTITKLALGLYRPTSGRILIDDYDLTQVSLRSLRQQVGVVDQDTFLFGGTIRENISVGYPEATMEQIIAAAQLAGAHEFIKDLPMAYETQIGEGGGMLSGGQRQRLAIARALVGDPHLLILDEATSHLDAESERIIQNNLDRILQERTTLIIAHRLSTIQNADLILVLDKGLLAESGTHQQLMNQRGHYYYLNQQQLATV